jgi:hypothetical protein
VNFLDLNITVVYFSGSAGFDFRIYRKPGIAYAYLPCGSYHATQFIQGWLKAEAHTLLTYSNPLLTQVATKSHRLRRQQWWCCATAA